MLESLKAKLEPRGIFVEDISIINFKFSDEFTKAIELKQVMEQTALAEKNKLVAVEYQAQQSVVSARGQAEAIKIQMESLKQNGGDAYIKLKALENQAKYIEVLNNKWSGAYPNVLMGGGSSNLLLDVSNYANTTN
jgi:regulator of protease activity HflC (stomatin/prohibitin superfamily)